MDIPDTASSNLDEILGCLLDESSSGVVLRGGVGSGKTHLLRSVHEALSGHPRLGRRPVGIARGRPSGMPGVGAGPVVVLADNLETWSHSALAQLWDLLEDRPGHIVAAVRTRGAERVLGSLRCTRLPRVLDLEPWDAERVAAYARSVLGAPLHPGSAHKLLAFTGGNPLCLTELLLPGAPQLADHLGVWTWSGVPVLPANAAARVRAGLSDVSRKVREFAAVLAVTGELPMATIHQAQLEGLVSMGERAGVVVVRGAGAAARVGLREPLEGQAVLSGLSSVRRRRICLDTAGRFGEGRNPGPGDWLSIGALYRAAGADPPAGVAARVAVAERGSGNPGREPVAITQDRHDGRVPKLWAAAASGSNPAAVHGRGMALLGRPGAAFDGRVVAATMLAAVQAGRAGEALRLCPDPPGREGPQAALFAMLRGIALLVTGRVTALEEHASAVVEQGLRRGWDQLLGSGLVLGGAAALSSADAGCAVTRFSAAHASLQRKGGWWGEAALLGWRAVAAHLAGLVRPVPDEDLPSGGRVPWLAEAFAELARGELALLRADRRAAAASAARLRSAAHERGNVLVELLAGHLCARVQPSEDVTARLARLAAEADFEVANLHARYAEALLRADGRELTDLAHDYAGSGLVLLAAEAAGNALQVNGGGPTPVWVVRARRLIDELPLHDFAVPPWWGIRPARVRPLTLREREVAAAAARGLTSAAIATHLGISTRTVDNHLSKVFRKLGVGSRVELARALRAAHA